MVSSGSARSQNAVKPRISQNKVAIIARWLPSSAVSPDEITASATCGDKKLLETAHAFQLIHLRGDAALQILVEGFNFCRSAFERFKLTHVFDGNHCLFCKDFDQFYLAFIKWPDFVTEQDETSYTSVRRDQMNKEVGSDALLLNKRGYIRNAIPIFVRIGHVGQVNDVSAKDCPRGKRALRIHRDSACAVNLNGAVLGAMMCNHSLVRIARLGHD